MTVGDTVAAGVLRLRAAGIEGAARDARLLMAEALGLAPDRLTLTMGDGLDAASAARFEAFIADRVRRRPVAQIIGRRAFWGRDFAVSGAVLDPRPETETLVALALAAAPARRILDLGTGSGAILVTLLAEWPSATGQGIDVAADALAIAIANAARHGVAARADFRQGSWFAPVRSRFDLVVSNPPYLSEIELETVAPEVRAWEPHGALVSGPTGLEAYRALAAGLAGVLEPGGRGFFEIGAGQGRDVAAIFDAAGWPQVAVHQDLDGRDRVVSVGP